MHSLTCYSLALITFQVDIGLTVENGRQRYEFMFDIKTPQRDYYLGTEREREMTRSSDS